MPIFAMTHCNSSQKYFIAEKDIAIDGQGEVRRANSDTGLANIALFNRTSDWGHLSELFSYDQCTARTACHKKIPRKKDYHVSHFLIIHRFERHFGHLSHVPLILPYNKAV